MRDLSREKDRTREAVSQIVSWCLVIALHQTYGIGKRRQEDVAAQALKIQKKAAVMLAKMSRAEVIGWLRSNFADAELPDDALLFRVPLRRAPRKRREEELRMAGDQAATFTWLIFALAIRRALGYGAQRLIKLHDETLLNYRQFSEWELDGADWAFSRLQHCAEQALQEKLNIVETNEPAPTKAEKASYQLQVGLCVREAVSQSCVGTAVSTQNVPAALPLAVLSGVGFERMLGGERT